MDEKDNIQQAGIKAQSEQPRERKRPKIRGMEAVLFSIALLLVACLIMAIFCGVMLAGGINSLFDRTPLRNSPPNGSYSIVSVEGTIQTGNSSGYQHSASVQYVKQLKEDEGNLGILLYMNTGGGGVYESDEMYRALMEYKESTGRPVWAYMAKTCASGGYYICAAADEIYANYGTTTGSIGVYYQFTDLSGLYEMFGVETVLIRSGDNKGIGVQGAAITEANRAVYQDMVEESYERFISLIAEGRDMPLATVRALGDGRPYTALQALENGLVDELAEWEAVKGAFEEYTGGTAYQTSFSSSTKLSSLFSELSVLFRSESQTALELAEQQPNGVLMASAEGLW